MSMVDEEVIAKIAEVVVFVSMVDEEVDAKIAEVVVFVSMVDEEVIAKIAEVEVFVSMIDCGGSGICEHGQRRSRCKDCNYFKTCHLCISKQALQKEKGVPYNRNANISRERILLQQINIRSGLVLLATKMLLLLQ